jgi:hypothetical protein
MNIGERKFKAKEYVVMVLVGFAIILITWRFLFV